MKRYNKILSLAAAMLMLANGCEYNETYFEELPDVSQPKNVSAYEYEITSADLTTIVNALRLNRNHEDSVMATQLNADKAFSDIAPSDMLIPYALKNVYFTADLGSSAKVSFTYKSNRNEMLTQLSAAPYVLSAADYKSIWGSDVNYVESLTPAKSPATEIAKLLAVANPNAESGSYKVVQYSYAEAEPVVDVTEVKYLYADFEGGSNGSTVPVAIDGWLNKDVTGTRFWQVRIFSNNLYAQFSSNNTNEENTIWLISAEVDLTHATAPQFSFLTTGGYHNGDLLSVHISENFDGTEAGITTAAWTDISSTLNLPTTPELPASAYGTLRSSDTLDLSSYVGKKIRIGFKYAGNGIGNVATTTYQLDDITVSEVTQAWTIANKATRYAAWQYDGTVWKEAAASSIIVLQPDDYTAMGVGSYLSTTQAPSYLPIFLALKYPYAQDGNTLTLVFKSSSTACYAETYTFTAGAWAAVSQTETRTEQYVMATTGWMFDPTIVRTIKRYDTDDVQKFITYIQTEMSDNWFPYTGRTNEDHYYGFNAYYGEIMYDGTRSTYGDDSIRACETNDEKYALFDQRVKEAFPIYASLVYPTLQTHVSGVEQLLKVRIEHYFSSSDRRYFEHTLRCIVSGTGEANPAQFEYVTNEQIPGL
ncbi:MAG: DUF5017 domain-containing protein [Prevotellaceae bacterium]|jgi:hypothetical protein|nr:DUF5017 domain-containing protein [Prevotellaceae bacterium]